MPQQTTPSRLALRFFVLTVLGAFAHAGAQAYIPPPPPLTTAPCVPTKKVPCTAPNITPPPPTVDKFAFPGDAPSETGSGFSTRNPSANPTPKPTSNSDPFPFPTGDSNPAPSSSSSSSSSGTSSIPDPDDPTPKDSPALKDGGSSGSTPASRRKLAKVEDLNERELKDIEVSHFYLTTGDFLGAYNRAKDAIRLFPDDPEAHFALAAAAHKLGKKDEAVAEYKSYLQLEPDGDHVKVAQHALAQIK